MGQVPSLPIYAAFLGAIFLIVQNILMVNVGMYRTKLGKGVGVDGNVTLERLVRRHGNFVENAALFVLILAVYELLVGQTALAFWLAVAFGAARLMHIAGFFHEAGSHLAGVQGGKRVFLALRAGGAAISAITSFVLGAATLLAVLSRH